MDEDSFDPRNWAKPPEQIGKNQSDKSEIAGNSPETPGTLFAPRPAAPAPTPPARTPFFAQHGPLLGSALLLVAGAAGAWATRVTPAPAVMASPEAAAPKPSGTVERRLTLAGVGDIAGALTAAGSSPADAQAAAQALGSALTAQGEVHAVIQLAPGDTGALVLQHVQASASDGSGAVVNRDASGHFAATAVQRELTRQVKILRGELDTNSFYSSAVAAGLVDTLIPEFINAFSYDVNLASEVSPGDTFEVAYEQAVDGGGNAVGAPQLLFASLTTRAKSLALYRYQPQGGEVGWYDGNGASTKRGLMRTPVDGARITSTFGMRFHPVLHYTRLHAGVDFAVPVGTPVYAAAAGTVIGATPTACGGNMAVVRHENGWITRYFHLSHYAPGLHEGQQVPQGFTLGLSGTTGTCTTGPHLHFELRIDDQPVDPLSVKMDDDKRQRLEGSALAPFIAQRNRVDVARASQSG